MIEFSRTQEAIDTPFIPNRNPQWGGNPGPSGIESTDVQSAIEEAFSDAIANDRFVLLTHYGGNASTGRYLEWYPQEPSNVSPITFDTSVRLLSVTCQTTAASATCTIGIFDLNVSSVTPVYSFSMVAQKRVSYSGSPLTIILANSLMAVRVTSGSINTPEMQVTLSSST